MSLAKNIEETIYQTLAEKHSDDVINTINKDESLITTGLLDSMDFITMLMNIENTFDLDIDFEDADPVAFTAINGLVKLLSEQQNA
ncbi:MULTISPECIES: acyl carrier protein [Pseudoalteromonas]|uniref:Acyl carrier protein n=1 Tax=Pseudoalteromonas obscura TaxID=3048491 RepID=A0ABT7ETN1_9GAMM|nr:MULTISPECIES: acyl carrier protein [Pseudoalteromonas]MBQ4836980.1 acyl carrier protein [Pseudoalteromonas luteoviolacea]MDK2598421.1 acyl carrier protein [Pseudoalteromonas sp. P94(2023)]